jgi:hypothetical protein
MSPLIHSFSGGRSPENSPELISRWSELKKARGGHGEVVCGGLRPVGGRNHSELTGIAAVSSPAMYRAFTDHRRLRGALAGVRWTWRWSEVQQTRR